MTLDEIRKHVDDSLFVSSSQKQLFDALIEVAKKSTDYVLASNPVDLQPLKDSLAVLNFITSRL